jgi:hypothetical protein
MHGTFSIKNSFLVRQVTIGLSLKLPYFPVLPDPLGTLAMMGLNPPLLYFPSRLLSYTC